MHINKHTVYSVLDIRKFFESGGRSKDWKNLSANAIQVLQVHWGPVRYLLIDEISIVSSKLLAQTNAQLAIAKNLSDKTAVFSGLNVICVVILCSFLQ